MKNIKNAVITIENYVTGKKEDVVLKNKELFKDGYFTVKVKLGNKEFFVYDNQLPPQVEIVGENTEDVAE